MKIKKNKPIYKCPAKTKDGLPCKGRLILEDGLCSHHSPLNKARRVEIAKLGGRAHKGLDIDLGSFKVTDSRDAYLLLKHVLTAIGRKDNMSPGELRIFPSLLKELRELEQQCELLDKLEYYEQVMGVKK